MVFELKKKFIKGFNEKIITQYNPSLFTKFEMEQKEKERIERIKKYNQKSLLDE